MSKNIFFDKEHHEFALANTDATQAPYEEILQPLSVIVQVTRRCPLHCAFCSESDQFEDPSFDSLLELKARLKGVSRIYLSGGEPLLRPDIFALLASYRHDFPVLGLPTNCVYINKDICSQLKGTISYINAGLDGPRKINDLVRGGYDQIVAGLADLRGSGIEVSLSTVILKSTLAYTNYVMQIADDLGVVKVKMVIPVPRGRAKGLHPEDFAQEQDILAKFQEIATLKKVLGWKPRVKFTFWDRTTEGYALLIYPNRKVYAWPVLDAPDSAVLIGDLNEQTIQSVWMTYPYKKNHINKYVGVTMHKA